MDREKLLILIEKIKGLGYSYDTETVLTLEEYFDGNTEEYSTLCANTGHAPRANVLKAFLLNIRNKSSVKDVLMRVYDYEDALQFNDCWISTDTVFVITTAKNTEVEEWFVSLEPSEIYEEHDVSSFNNLPDIRSGYRLLGVWWD